MSARTPGPWQRRWSHETSITDDERTVETCRIVHERLGTICHLVITDAVEADARLIAAAPDLYEALVRLLEHLPPAYMVTNEPEGEALYDAALARARAAIAHAEGRP